MPAYTLKLRRSDPQAAAPRSRRYCFTKSSTSAAMIIAHACIGTIGAVWMASGVTGVDTIEIVPIRHSAETALPDTRLAQFGGATRRRAGRRSTSGSHSRRVALGRRRRS